MATVSNPPSTSSAAVTFDYIIFECLAERTVSISPDQAPPNPELGYNDLFDYRFTRILDALVDLRAETKRAPRIVTNMGAANPTAAAKRCLAMATRAATSPGLKIVMRHRRRQDR